MNLSKHMAGVANGLPFLFTLGGCMYLCRLIAPEWLRNTRPDLPKALEGIFSPQQLKEHNSTGYGIYYLPNSPSHYEKNIIIKGADIDTFTWVFVDCDLKDGDYDSKEQFIEVLGTAGIEPSKIVDSGNGIHAYWQVSNLDAMSYLRFQRRLAHMYVTDDATSSLFQLMRHPGYINTKYKDAFVPCDLLFESKASYTAEELDRLLPPITAEDEQKCQVHFDKTYGLNQDDTPIDDSLPPKFGQLLTQSTEAKLIWAGDTDDRSKNDFRLGHILFANAFTREEALSVLINSAKALQRAPVHRRSYAMNIVDKIWTYEQGQPKDKLALSQSVKSILQRSQEALEGQRFPCWKYIDNTEAGFRLGHVMGLVAGSGVGKTAMALNLFLGFVASNPDYDHFFCSLEMVDREIAARWKTMCGTNDRLHDKVHIISNYDEKGTFRDLSLDNIREYVLKFKESTGRKVGCVVIDHIGILCNNNRLGQDEGVKQIAKAMKSFAIETDTFLIMQSQTSREKAGVGDLELNKDAAFGTSVFENFCDFLVTLWQPVKRMYSQGAPTIMAFKFCKIRHKNQAKDTILEDVPYTLFFDPTSQRLKEMTQDQQISFKYFLTQATAKRKNDRKTELVEYTSVRPTEEAPNVVVATANSDRHSTRH